MDAPTTSQPGLVFPGSVTRTRLSLTGDPFRAVCTCFLIADDLTCCRRQVRSLPPVQLSLSISITTPNLILTSNPVSFMPSSPVNQSTIPGETPASSACSGRPTKRDLTTTTHPVYASLPVLLLAAFVATLGEQRLGATWADRRSSVAGTDDRASRGPSARK